MGWLYLFLTIVVAFFLYWMRDRCRFCYGTLEILVGLLIMALVWVPPFGPQYLNLEDNEPSIWFFTLPKAVGVFSGVYVFIRGLDNINAVARLKGRPSARRSDPVN